MRYYLMTIGICIGIIGVMLVAWHVSTTAAIGVLLIIWGENLCRRATTHASMMCLALAVFSTPAWAYDVLVAYQYQAVAVTATSQTVDFANPCSELLLINDGANEVYIDFAAQTATTSDFQLKVDESVAFRSVLDGFAVVCAAAETATLRVLCLRGRPRAPQ